MNSPVCGDPDIRASLGFYVTGKLSADERVAVQRHLAECAYCQAERDDVDRVMPALGLLGADDIRALVAQFGVPDPATPDDPTAPPAPPEHSASAAPAPAQPADSSPTSVASASTGPADPVLPSVLSASTRSVASSASPSASASTPPADPPATPAVPSTQPAVDPAAAGSSAADSAAADRAAAGSAAADRAAAGSAAADRAAAGSAAADRAAAGWAAAPVVDRPPGRPAGRPPGRADGASGPLARDARPGRRGRRVRLALGALVVVAAGLVAVVAVWQPGAAPPSPAGVVASTDDAATGASLAVEVSGQDRLTARATITGLREGTRYVLHAVTANGESVVVAELTAGAGSQVVTGSLDVPVSALAFFSVSEADGTVVVSAPVSPGPSSPTPK